MLLHPEHQSGVTPIQLLKSPWGESFQAFNRSIHHYALLVSPFVTESPLRHLARQIVLTGNPQIEIVTNLAPDHLIQGSMDPMGIADFFRAVPNVVVTHLPSLHAKVYVADESVAIITSANLTHGGIVANYEYGVWIEDAEVIRQITQDLKAYAALGSNVTLLELEELATASRELQQYQKRVLETARDNLREEFQRRIQATHEALRRIRAKPGESTNSIFTRTILFLLKRGPLTTQQLHPLVQQIHPDLCDDNIDRVIGEVHFGKRWKHMVRNAQQALKSKGLICLRGGKWHIAA